MNKYRAKKVSLDGYTFASRAEARRYTELKLMLKANEIECLGVHPKFQMTIRGVKADTITYIADFRYLDRRTRKLVVEDVKGFKTPVYNLKKRLMLALYGIEVKEVRA